ncbi:hypothetical protein SAY86_010382 [Trapa natans]|uniref:DUF8003 domain-containing protein n=1 Tax=Trapa natans TaxID=22666 RepID=A0AAN7LKG8_TRANT|nr:hypothetical protein SAY86_010382 [Trapa natans]
MALYTLLCIQLAVFLALILNPRTVVALPESDPSSSNLDELLFRQDYSPPAPPPPPPHPPSVSCEDDLGGIGNLDTMCQIVSDLNFTKDVYIAGGGNLAILPSVRFHCLRVGCEITVNITGNFCLGENATVVTGTFELNAFNASFSNGTTVNTTGLGGAPPPQTSGTPQGIVGSGGGHGGRGADCYTEKDKEEGKTPDDVWGGDAYSWQSLENPWSYGSKGGSTSREVDYGGGGGGRVKLVIVGYLEVNGSLMADGANGGQKGGGGSGGSIYVRAQRMTGNGRISACGGDGYAGGGGGRVSVDIFSRHDDPKIFAHGGKSLTCPSNNGGAGTFYDAVPRRLIVDNCNMSTDSDTLMMEFPNQPLWTNIYVRNRAKASVPLLWSRVQVQGQILINQGSLSFGLERYATSEFELLAEELLMSDSLIRVYGALRMSVKIFLLWKSKMFIDGGGDTTVATTLLEASNLIVLKGASVIRSNANLGVHGQGLLDLSGSGDLIEAQRLVLSLFYSIHIGPDSVLRGPSNNVTSDAIIPRLQCDSQDCPVELLQPPEDCNVNSSLAFTLQICRVEDIIVEGLIEGSVVHFHRARTVAVHSSGIISSSGLGCSGGLGRGTVINGIGSGGGHGGRGGSGCYGNTCIQGGISYGNQEMPCELGSGSGNHSSSGATAGGGVIVMGSVDHPLSRLFIEGSVRSDGQSFQSLFSKEELPFLNSSNGGPGGGSGGSVLMFLRGLNIVKSAVLSSVGGRGSPNGGGGGGGGRIHFHWADIPTGDVYQPIASVNGSIDAGGGLGKYYSNNGENGTVTGKACPKGLYGIFCEECPIGTYKNVTGSDKGLCHPCPANELPRRAVYLAVRGGISETPCPFECISERYHMPHCYTALEELIYTFGGPWLFGFLLVGLLILLALVLSVARMKFVGMDELSGPTPTQRGSQIDHSFPFLESLNEVLETNRAEESQSHVHRMYFMGPNTFSEPWHLPHTPPEQIKEIVYEGAFNTFVDEINAIAAYQWWEGAIYSILCVLAYPLAWSWQQWRRRLKLQRLREFVRSEYDHSCLRSCRSRALYEGIKVAATSDLLLAYVDFFLGGDEKRSDLPVRLHQRFPMAIVFGGDGSYMAPFSLQSDSILTSLMSQAVPPTTWYRLVAGLNAQLRLVCSGRLRVTFRPVLRWLETHANPGLRVHGVQVDLAWFQATTCRYFQYGILLYAVEEQNDVAHPESIQGNMLAERHNRIKSVIKESLTSTQLGEALLSCPPRSSETHGSSKRTFGGVINISNLQMLIEKRDLFYILTFMVHNTKPVGHQDLVGLVISMLLLGDISLVMLTLLQLYSISLVDLFLVLFIFPLGVVLPFPAGINALFSHGPRRSAGLARVYALWNMTSLGNVVVAFLCGYLHYNVQSSGKKLPYLQPWNISMDESEWWIFPVGLVLCKALQSQLINWHAANLEIQDLSLYSGDFDLFWQS